MIAMDFSLTDGCFQVVVIASVSWIAVAVQAFILVVLRRRQRLLIQRKLHMHAWSSELIPQLKEMHQELQIDVMEAEAHGHDHLPARHESSMDGDDDVRGTGYTTGLREQYEAAAYSRQLEKRIRWIAHCVSMWSCFSLAYYCMDLVVVVGGAGWGTAWRILAHVLLIAPHVLLSLVLSPAVMKYESLLSCVVRRVDELVATVVEQMERTTRLCESLRSKVVDAHRQDQEELSPTRSVRRRRARLQSATSASITAERQARQRELSLHLGSTLHRSTSAHSADHSDTSTASHYQGDHLDFSTEEVASAVRWIYKRVSHGDKEVTLRQLRIGLHKINAYFTDKDWASLCRLLDREHKQAITANDLLQVLAGGAVAMEPAAAAPAHTASRNRRET